VRDCGVAVVGEVGAEIDVSLAQVVGVAAAVLGDG
jgi:hypothetical protein